MKIKDIHIGDRLWWHDPDAIEGNVDPRPVTVVRVEGEIVSCIFDSTVAGFGEVEAFAHELSRKEE